MLSRSRYAKTEPMKRGRIMFTYFLAKEPFNIPVSFMSLILLFVHQVLETDFVNAGRFAHKG